MPPRNTWQIRSADTLRALRIAVGLTQADLAERAVKAEGGPLKRQVITALESGRSDRCSRVDYATARSIAATLGVPLAVLWEPKTPTARIPAPRREPSHVTA